MIKSDVDLPGLKQRTWALNLPLLVPLHEHMYKFYQNHQLQYLCFLS